MEGNEKGKGIAYECASGIEGELGMRGCYMHAASAHE